MNNTFRNTISWISLDVPLSMSLLVWVKMPSFDFEQNLMCWKRSLTP